MTSWIEERIERYREFFGVDSSVNLLPPNAPHFELTPETEALRHFNIEWHFVPCANAIAFDDAYLKRFYPTAIRFQSKSPKFEPKILESLSKGHRRQQGYIVGIETTPKPCYLPRNRQFYGTKHGHDANTDPFAAYLGLAGMTNGTRYDQRYPLLRKLLDLLNEEWRKKKLLPDGYRVTVCPPGIFNLIGTVFHPEWSETETLELGFYRDERGNATCYAVGANSPGDFSFIDIIEGEEWSLTGFRIALLPDATRHDAKCS
jgi:hypothetical protein